MRTVKAICSNSFRKSVKRAAGVQPVLAPPLAYPNFLPQVLEGADLLYLKLHGLARQPYWYGDNYITTMSAEQVAMANLSNTVVFATMCYLAPSWRIPPQMLFEPLTNTPKRMASPMFRALQTANAKAIIAGTGPNYAGRTKLYGTDILGLVFRLLYTNGFSARLALKLAKLKLTHARQDRVTRDTLEFKFYQHSEATPWPKS